MRLTLCTFAIASLLCIGANAAEPADSARSAFFAVEEKPYHSDVVHKAKRDVEQAYLQQPRDPWVLIALSRLALEDGYQRGWRDRLSSYSASAVDKALDYAKAAVSAGPSEFMAHVALARVQIITENYTGAWDSLNKAHDLDKQDFYYWYLLAVLAFEKKDSHYAHTMVDGAERRARLTYQRRWVLELRGNLAHRENDVRAEEDAYRRSIELEPAEPQLYGNYANFLKQQHRYEDAITYYQRAIAIKPYPLAIEELRQLELLRRASTDK
jgi:tetratricopeptide (TPR) repeat protein